MEYCLGRDTMRVPVGPITDTVAWYGTLWQLDKGQAFIARPAPAVGKASTQQAMLEFGMGPALPDFQDLVVNTDSATLREQLGRRIGIEENLSDPGTRSLRAPLEANLGHAALLCLQTQNEIASANAIFHRQGERGIEDALRDTIPYFLGAVPHDQALKRARLRDARRALQRGEATLRAAQLASATIDTELRALLAEARAVNLVPDEDITDHAQLIRVLQAARVPAPRERQASEVLQEQDRRVALERERDALQRALRRVMSERALLLDQRDGLGGYEESLELQISRLSSLDLIDPPLANGDDSDGIANQEHRCPACGQNMREPDPTAMTMRASLERLREELGSISQARPAQRAALERLDNEASSLREQLSSIEAALNALLAADRVGQESGGDSRDFIRGRIDATLARLSSAGDVELARLQEEVATYAAMVQALEAELDDNEDREQLTSRLLSVGRDMTSYAKRLGLEHSGEVVRLDLARLTVVTDTERGPVPLFRIGSAANWIGYHLVTHLALHRHFVRQTRPVPRFLMLDQPTQAYYPSEVARRTGIAESDADREAVRRMFELIRDVVHELAPALQVIVCDHANLPEQWFQDSITHNWRDGRKLVPEEWLSSR
ncbi:DUF3732 domain-containing protein [Microbispora sp. ZYX-F-249]|uniref:DUF3732 domain-containing protein n=1 Tax=Microbispora maris TaxID=3144104 RepID=A0ABV0AZD6_9ACTN